MGGEMNYPAAISAAIDTLKGARVNLRSLTELQEAPVGRVSSQTAPLGAEIYKHGNQPQWIADQLRKMEGQ